MGFAGRRRGNLQHCVYTDFRQVTDLQQAWDACVEAGGADVFSTYDWCNVWWQHYGYGRRLQIHLFRQGSRIVAVFPLFWERLWLGPLSVRVVRIVGSDHSVTTCGLPVCPGKMRETVKAVVKELDRSWAWDLLYFGPLSGYFTQRAALAEALRGCSSIGEAVADGNVGPHICFDLPRTYEMYLDTLSSNERHNIRKRERRLNKKQDLCVGIVTPAQLTEAFGDFVRQHQTQWQHQGQMGHFDDWPGARAFHYDVARAQSRRGRLMLVQLRAGGETLGYQYNYRFARRVHWILTSRTLNSAWTYYSPGRLLHCAVVRAAIESKVRQIDAMRGLYDYKLRLGGLVLQLQSVAATHEGFSRWLRVGIARHGFRLLDRFYYRIWFCRLAPRLPYLQRSLWSVWIRSRI